MNRKLPLFFILLILLGTGLDRLWAQCCPDRNSIINNFAGNGISGYSGDGGLATTASLSGLLFGVSSDSAGNVYISDTGNNVVRKVTPAGVITTVAGNGTGGYSGDGGAATLAQLSNPTYTAVDAAGNLYICDFGNSVVRKVTPAGIISTFAGNGTAAYGGDGGPATSASLNQPFGITVDAAGNVFIADRGNSAIRRVAPSGIITTIAGTGTAGFSGDGGFATSAQLSGPEAVCLGPNGDMYFFDDFNFRLRKINSCGIITTVGGTGNSGYTGDGGPALSADLGDIHGMGFCGSNLYLADVDQDVIREINICGTISTLTGNGSMSDTGNGGLAGLATISQPQGLTVDPFGNLYFTEFQMSMVRKISPDCSPSPTPACLTPTPGCTVPPTPTPTNTFTPTSTPTITFTPTITSTPIAGCEAFYISENLFRPSQGSVSIFVSTCQYPGPYHFWIFNTAGEHIKTLDDQDLGQPFQASYLWDGTNKYGDPCASGVYIFCLVEPYNRQIKRVLLVR